MGAREPVNILMVDDQPAKLLSYEIILAELGENLIRANSGKEALEQLLKNDIAVVLVDVCMPELDGFELATMIRRHPRFQRTAIILVSGVFVEDTDRLKGYDSGAVDYVSVPIIPEVLRAKVAVFAETFRKNIELQKLNQELEQRVAERTAEIEAAAARLRQSEERLRLVLSAGGIQGWTWDILKNEITWVTPSVSARAEPLVETFEQSMIVVHPDDREIIQKALEQSISTGAEYYAEFRTVEFKKEQWWLGHGTVIRDPDGDPISIAGININITGRKRAEEERAVLLKNAEDARRESEKANQLKDEFLATLSHELRTPLNAITGWVHMLRSGGLDRATQAKAVETINRNAMLQTQLIADILDVSRITSGKLRLDLKPVDLPSVIQAALDTVRPAANAREISIEAALASDLELITGDPARLQQIVWNLLSNAVKFSPRGGHVQIALERNGSALELTVQDDGAGIRPDFLPYIFERFRQGDSSSTRGHQGLGLGLAIVRHLMEMHGGQVCAMNREDRSGAIFKATLPMRRVETETVNGVPQLHPRAVETEISPYAPPSLKGMRLVVVDDEADAREVVALVLEQCGAEVRVAASVMEALGIIEREPPDAVIADIEMPGEDGYSLVRKLKALPADRGGLTPAIALTAYASTQDCAKSLKAGFDMHVPKPVQPSELAAIIANLVSSRRERMSDKNEAEASNIVRG